MRTTLDSVSLTTRMLGLTPSSYDSELHSVDAILSRGSPVQRIYGREELEISRKAINLGRMQTSIVPLLDSHSQASVTSALGRVVKAWIATDRDGAALMGQLIFNDTNEGRKAEGMVARREVTGISVGYSIEDMKLFDADGDEVDPRYARADDDDLTFRATAWTLAEASLCAVPADLHAGVLAAEALRFDQACKIRSPEQQLIIMRMRARVRMTMRAAGILCAEPVDYSARSSIFEETSERHHETIASGVDNTRYRNGPIYYKR